MFFAILPIALSLYTPVRGDQVFITDLPLYSQAGVDATLCVTSQFSTYVTSFGCSVTDPAACICSAASKSYRVASAISSCVAGVVTSRSDVTTATEILASYCLINAGVSARDQTLLQDFPLYTQGPFDVRFCATSISSQYSISYGCDFVTPAGCLCANSQSSYAVQSAMLSCASLAVLTKTQASTVSLLWSSYCSANLMTTATRQVNAVLTSSGSIPTRTSSATASTLINTATTTLMPFTFSASISSTSTVSTSTISSASTISTSTISSTSAVPISTSPSSASTSQNSPSLSVGATVGLAVACAFGAALLTVFATWYRPQQLGRILTCGRWPARKIDGDAEVSRVQERAQARTEMGEFFTGPFRSRG